MRLSLSVLNTRHLTNVIVAGGICLVGAASAQDQMPGPLPLEAPAASLGGVYAPPHLPKSHTRSIYFLPGSSRLDDSANAAIAQVVARFQADARLRVTVTGYSDAVGDGSQAEELRRSRPEEVAESLSRLGVDRRRIYIVSGDEDEDTAQCTSEWCRQSYRRVGLAFSRAPSGQ